MISSRKDFPMKRITRTGCLGLVTCAALLQASHGLAGMIAVDDGSLAPHDTQAEDWFGFALAVEDDLAVVGAWAHSALQTRGGAAYLYGRDASGWMTPVKITPADPQYDQRFGNSVAIAGNDVLVGAHHDETLAWASGAVYVFRHDGSAWQQVQKMIPNDGIEDGRFGITMAVSGTTALFGSRAGAAYVYVLEGASWELQQKLTAEDGAGEAERFGLRIAVDGDLAVVGASDATLSVGEEGAAYVFARTGAAWVQQQKLVAADGGPYDNFGTAVAIHGDTILVGSPYDDDAGSDAGAVYVFRFDGTTWSQQDKLVPSGGAPGDVFGSSLAMHGALALAGSPSDSEIASQAGAAYLLQDVNGAWSFAHKLTVPTSGADDHFGLAVATDGSTALVGAPSADQVALNVGMAYSFLLRLETGDPCSEEEACASGFCVDGVCCESACEGGAAASCRACSESAGSTADGVCGYASTGTECGAASCTGPAELRSESTCNGQGVCLEGNESPCDGGYVCRDGSCLDVCSSASDCVDGFFCSEANACVSLGENGADCGGADQCESGFCVQGVCCNEACGSGSCETGTCLASVDGGTGGSDGGSGGSSGAPGSSNSQDDGCGCRSVGTSAPTSGALALLMAGALFGWRRRRD
jgi:MYXO-CTERM domain-containing protein